MKHDTAIREDVAAAQRALEVESAAIACLGSRLDAQFEQVVDRLAAHAGAVVLTGVGKSGHVARHLAATLASTGTRAVFLHAGEAGHGDLGVVSPGDPVILVSNSGSTAELVRLCPVLREMGSPLIALVGNLRSPLAREADLVLDATVECEADGQNLVPTASSLAALALGHALTVALMTRRGFTLEDYGRLHPDGAIGRNLLVRVGDVMHSGEEVAWGRPEDSLKQVVIVMTRRALGAACIVDAEGGLAGLITDGDVRRAFETHDDIRELTARDVMTANPVTIGATDRLLEAIRLMENRPSQLSLLPVVESGKCLGIVRLHDVFRKDQLPERR